MELLIWILVTHISMTVGSIGDRSYFFTECLSSCQENCISLSSIHRSIVDQYTFWTCDDQCQYDCMWKTVDIFVENGWSIPQFHGKWPFVRWFGMQEPASTIFSVFNLLSFVFCLRKIRSCVSPKLKSLRRLWTTYSYVGITAWIFSTIFHCRDVFWTEKLDYFCAFALILFGFYASLVRIFGPESTWSYAIFGAPLLAFYCYHINYLSFGKFDYGYHVRTSILMGICNSSAWIGWSIFMKFRWRQNYVWKCALPILAACALISLEAFDFPPFFWIFDAHSLWHLGTTPLPIFWAQNLLNLVVHALHRYSGNTVAVLFLAFLIYKRFSTIMYNSNSDSPSRMVYNCFTLEATFYDRNFLSTFGAIWLTLSFLPVVGLLFCLLVIFAILLAFFMFWAAVLIVTILFFVCIILLAAALVAFWIALTAFTIWFTFDYLLKSCFNFVPYSAGFSDTSINSQNLKRRNSFD